MYARADMCALHVARARVRAGTDRKHRSQRMTYGCIRHARRRGRMREKERESEREVEVTHQGMEMFG